MAADLMTNEASIEVQMARLEERIDGRVKEIFGAISGLGERISGEMRGMQADYRFADRELHQKIEDIRETVHTHQDNGGHKDLRNEVQALRRELDAWKNRAVGIGIGATLLGGGVAGALVKLLS